MSWPAQILVYSSGPLPDPAPGSTDPNNPIAYDRATADNHPYNDSATYQGRPYWFYYDSANSATWVCFYSTAGVFFLARVDQFANLAALDDEILYNWDVQVWGDNYGDGSDFADWYNSYGDLIPTPAVSNPPDIEDLATDLIHGPATDGFGDANEITNDGAELIFPSDYSAGITGSSSYLPSGNAARTVALDMMPLAIRDYSQLFAYGQDHVSLGYFGVGISYAGTALSLGTWGNDQDVAYSFSVGQWYRIVIAWDGAAAKYYVGNDFSGTFSSIQSPINTVSGDYRMSLNGDSSPSFCGKLKNIKIWDLALTAVEVTSYNGGTVPHADHLVFSVLPTVTANRRRRLLLGV